MLILTQIDLSRRGTLTEQIVTGIQRLVDERELRPEARLPSIRQFAAAHRISKFTVIQAYDRLAASGHIHSRPGAGFFVGKPTQCSDAIDRESGLNKANDISWYMNRQTNDCHLKHLPGYGWLPPRWLEGCGLGRAMRGISRRGTRCFLDGYGNPRGFTPLIEILRLRLADIGVDVPADQIMLTNGATGGIDLISRYLVRTDDVVFIDDPGHFAAFGQMRALGATVKGVPWTGNGPDLERLDAMARTYSPRLFLTTPIIQNPTGCSISQGTAFRLLQLAERHDFYIVEDDVLGTLHPDPPPRLASLDQLNRVIYVNSFSKEMSPRLRVGYLAGHRDLVRDLVDLKNVAQATSPEFTERLVHEVLVLGQYRKHLTKLRVHLQRARDEALRDLESIGLEPCGEDTHGLFAWMQVPGIADATPLAEAAVEHGMLLAPGSMFRPEPAPSAMMRFNVGFCQAPGTLRLLEALLNSTATAHQ